MLDRLSKPALIEICRRLGIKTGDTARNPKGYYVESLLSHPEQAEVEAALAELAARLNLAPMPEAAVITANPGVPEHPEGIAVIGRKRVSEVFGFRGKFGEMEIAIWNDPDAPEFDPDFSFDKEKLEEVLIAIETGINPWLYGPAGTGKTEFMRNVAAKLGRAFYRVSFDAALERYEFLGGERARAGSTVWQDGTVLIAMTRPGAIVLLDEVGFARPEYLSALHAVLEPNATLTITETGRRVRKAEGVVFAAADNSNGTGDATGLYAGLRQQNRAFTSRFGIFVRFDYLEGDTEARVIAVRSGCNEDLAGNLVKFLAVCRQHAESAVIEEAPSLREAFALAKMLMRGMNPRRAFEVAMVNRVSADNAEQLQQLWKANVDEDALVAAVEGTYAKYLDSLKPAAPPVNPDAPPFNPPTY